MYTSVKLVLNSTLSKRSTWTLIWNKLSGTVKIFERHVPWWRQKKLTHEVWGPTGQFITIWSQNNAYRPRQSVINYYTTGATSEHPYVQIKKNQTKVFFLFHMRCHIMRTLWVQSLYNVILRRNFHYHHNPQFYSAIKLKLFLTLQVCLKILATTRVQIILQYFLTNSNMAPIFLLNLTNLSMHSSVTMDLQLATCDTFFVLI